MTTPLIILGLLTAPYVALCAWESVSGKPVNRAVGAVMGLGAVFMFSGVGHFVRTGPMSEMLPPWVPVRVALIYLTGLLEIALALALLLPSLRRLAGWACIAVLVLFFPANIYAAINQVGMGGHLWGPVYLLIRGPLQIILIIWAYRLVVRRQAPTGSEGG
jgi:uncharacterized membrane protein